jgi:hypothetical protein
VAFVALPGRATQVANGSGLAEVALISHSAKLDFSGFALWAWIV